MGNTISEKILAVHFYPYPNKDILSAEHVKFIREFAKEHKIKRYKSYSGT
jgi:3-isopropylmalate/(R)-2-methylmalate dehydratase large subunit